MHSLSPADISWPEEEDIVNDAIFQRPKKSQTGHLMQWRWSWNYTTEIVFVFCRRTYEAQARSSFWLPAASSEMAKIWVFPSGTTERSTGLAPLFFAKIDRIRMASARNMNRKFLGLIPNFLTMARTTPQMWSTNSKAGTDGQTQPAAGPSPSPENKHRH